MAVLDTPKNQEEMMSDFHTHYEEFKVHGKDLLEKIKALIHEGNIRRIIIKDQKGITFVEIPQIGRAHV
jgi:fructose-1,6-bisphosphatase